MKTRELSMGEIEAIVKLREYGKSIRAIAQILAIASTTNWNVLKKKETTGVLSNRRRTGRPRKTTAVDDRIIVRAVKKDPKTTVVDISNNFQSSGPRFPITMDLRSYDHFPDGSCDPSSISLERFPKLLLT